MLNLYTHPFGEIESISKIEMVWICDGKRNECTILGNNFKNFSCSEIKLLTYRIDYDFYSISHIYFDICFHTNMMNLLAEEDFIIHISFFSNRSECSTMIRYHKSQKKEFHHSIRKVCFFKNCFVNRPHFFKQ